MKDPTGGTMSIVSPASGDTLGLQFSVYGTCSALTTTNMTMTVTVTDTNTGQPLGTATTQNNLEAGTWEAVFDLPAGTSQTGAGKIEVACPGTGTAMNCTPVTGLTIEAQNVLTITRPTSGESFPLGTAVGTGGRASGYTVHLYVTHAGSQLTTVQPQAKGTRNGNYEVGLQELPPGPDYVLHAHVVDENGKDVVRLSSPFFSVFEMPPAPPLGGE